MLDRNEIEALKSILEETRRKVGAGAMVGFNWADKSNGEWVEDLYTNNAALSSAIKMLEKKLKD